MNKFQQMQIDLNAVTGSIHYDSDAVISIWIGSLDAYNNGLLVGRWISLPTDEDDLKQVMDIITENGMYDYEIMDREGAIGLVKDYSNPFKLNEIAEKLDALDDDQVEIVEWLVGDIGEDVEEVLDEEKYNEVSIYDSEQDAAGEIVDMHIDAIRSTERSMYGERGLKHSIDWLISHIDYDMVWRDLEIEATTHRSKDGRIFVYNG